MRPATPAVLLRRAACRARCARTTPLAFLLLAASRDASPLSLQIASLALGTAAGDLTGAAAVRAVRNALGEASS